MTPAGTVREFWTRMGSNDFHYAAEMLSENYECHWPQSGEVIVGRANFAAVNKEYPTIGAWRFRIERLIADGPEVVTHTLVANDAISTEVISFSTVSGGLIERQVEFWPDPFPAPDWRARWVEKAARN